jgi:hypothetical protein
MADAIMPDFLMSSAIFTLPALVNRRVSNTKTNKTQTSTLVPAPVPVPTHRTTQVKQIMKSAIFILNLSDLIITIIAIGVLFIGNGYNLF